MSYYTHLWTMFIDSLDNQFYDNDDSENFPRSSRIKVFLWINKILDLILIRMGKGR